MALNEDPASVLEQFIHDVANLPAEIQHLYEEMQAKQDVINECNTLIARKDTVELQQWVKFNGSLIPHPQEPNLVRAVNEAYKKAKGLQEEKIMFSTRACSLLDRYVRRLDLKIRDLQSEGSIPVDQSIPTLLRDSPNNLVPATSVLSIAAAANSNNNAVAAAIYNGPTNGNASTAISAARSISRAGTPLQPISANMASMPQVAALNRLAASNSMLVRSPNSTVAAQLHQTALTGGGASTTNSRAGTPGAQSRQQREGSIPSDAKRRRLNASLGINTSVGSNGNGAGPTSGGSGTGQLLATRPSSLGPGKTSRAGTPRAITPRASTPTASRAGSIGPGGRLGLKKVASLNSKKGASQTQSQSARGTGGAAAAGSIGGTPSAPTSATGRKAPAGTKLKKAGVGRKSGTSTRGDTPSTTTTTTTAGGITSDDDDDDSDDESSSVSSQALNAGPAASTQRRRKPGPPKGRNVKDKTANGRNTTGANTEDTGDDVSLYCYCKDISHGGMIMCENADCKTQWFHWHCVNIDSEPQGEWLCPGCRELPRDKIRRQ